MIPAMLALALLTASPSPATEAVQVRFDKVAFSSDSGSATFVFKWDGTALVNRLFELRVRPAGGPEVVLGEELVGEVRTVLFDTVRASAVSKSPASPKPVFSLGFEAEAFSKARGHERLRAAAVFEGGALRSFEYFAKNGKPAFKKR